MIVTEYIGNGDSGEIRETHLEFGAVPVDPPVILSQPAGRTLTRGTDLVLSVTADDPTGELEYQWLHDSVPVDGATGYNVYRTPAADGRISAWCLQPLLDPASLGPRWLAEADDSQARWLFERLTGHILGVVSPTLGLDGQRHARVAGNVVDQHRAAAGALEHAMHQRAHHLAGRDAGTGGCRGGVGRGADLRYGLELDLEQAVGVAEGQLLTTGAAGELVELIET